MFSPVLLAAKIDPLRDPAVFEAAYRAASPDRRQKVDRLRETEDQCRSLGAEMLLRLALRRVGVEPVELAFTYNAAGKPSLTTPESVSFSLSHSGDFVLCAVADGDVGCDVEQVSGVRPNLARRFFDAAEADHIDAQPTPDAQTDLFARYWTLKESFLKAIGAGLSRPLNSFRIVFGEGGVTVEPPENGRVYECREFDDLPDYRCALCMPHLPPDLRLEQISLL